MNNRIAAILERERRVSEAGTVTQDGIVTLSWDGVEQLLAEIERLEREAVEGRLDL